MGQSRLVYEYHSNFVAFCGNSNIRCLKGSISLGEPVWPKLINKYFWFKLRKYLNFCWYFVGLIQSISWSIWAPLRTRLMDQWYNVFDITISHVTGLLVITWQVDLHAHKTVHSKWTWTIPLRRKYLLGINLLSW